VTTLNGELHQRRSFEALETAVFSSRRSTTLFVSLMPHPACRICKNQPTIKPNLSRQSSATPLARLAARIPWENKSGIMQRSVCGGCGAGRCSEPKACCTGSGGGGPLKFATTVEEGLEAVCPLRNSGLAGSW